MVLEVGHLQLVDAVARAGTITRAADALHVTQPAVSHRLRELEDRLGVKLFRRAGRRMVPTGEGARLLESARSLLAEFERVEDEIRQHRDGERGMLRAATECYFCYGWLPSTFKRLRAALPNVDIQVVPQVTRNPLPALLDRTLDVAVVFNQPDDPRIVSRELFKDELVAVVALGHRLSRRTFATARDFESETLICHFVEDDRQDPFERDVLKPAGVRPAAVLEMRATVAVLEMVRAGLGVAVVPRWALPEGAAVNGLRVVRITRKGLFRRWHAAALRDQAAKPAVATMVRLLAEHVAQRTA
jgi:LysR family transcriptional regulator, regulator for metE and metH